MSFYSVAYVCETASQISTNRYIDIVRQFSYSFRNSTCLLYLVAPLQKEIYRRNTAKSTKYIYSAIKFFETLGRF